MIVDIDYIDDIGETVATPDYDGDYNNAKYDFDAGTVEIEPIEE